MTRDQLRERLMQLTEDQKLDVLMWLTDSQPAAVENAMREAEVL